MSFARDLKDFELKFSGATNDFVQGVEISLFSAVIKDSPVDTGRFRGNWQTSTSSPATGVTINVSPSGSSAISAMTSLVQSLNDGRVTFLTNNLPYAERLEYGYSKQAPGGMVRKNVARFQSIVNDQIGKHKI